MKEGEYRYTQWRLARHGVTCPRPDALIRGGIIAAVEVTGIITASESEWFGGSAGLALAHAAPADPIPVRGVPGYFEWQRAQAFAPVTQWMKRFDRTH